MGTNYYLHKNTCEHCGRSDEPIHIGKSSGGWCFALCVHPYDHINDLPDWVEEWKHGIIKNEYGETITPEEMLSIITERSRDKGWDEIEYGNGPLQYASEEAFHRSNHSQRGPNNLLRARIGPYCVGHGAGTWDLMPEGFS